MFQAVPGGTVVLAAVLVLSLAALFGGGVSYREECVVAGKVARSWTVTWLAPVPYAFRPDPAGNCAVHTGSRVVLDAVGIARYEPTRPAPVVSSAAYGAKMEVAVAAYMTRLDTAGSLQDALAAITTLVSEFAGLTPPRRYAAAHARLQAAGKDIEAGTAGMLRAASARKRSEFEAFARDARGAAVRLSAAATELERLQSTE